MQLYLGDNTFVSKITYAFKNLFIYLFFIPGNENRSLPWTQLFLSKDLFLPTEKYWDRLV